MAHFLGVRLSIAALLAGAAVSGAAHATAPPDWLLGDWMLNNERTHAIQPKQGRGGLGGIRAPSVSVGGVPVPLPGGGVAPSTGTASDPDVLRCANMTVTMRDANVHFLYQGAGEELMKPGNDQGRKTSWNRSTLTQSYETTTRKVSKRFQLQKDGSLLVTVKLSPKQAKGATHVRVFERGGERGGERDGERGDRSELEAPQPPG